MSSEQAMQAREVILPEVLSSERLLWTGRPRQSVIFQRRNLVAVPFGLMWLWILVPGVRVFRNPDIWPMALMYIPFVAIGVYLVIGQVVWEAWRRRGLYYGLTNRRVILVQKQWPRHINSIGLFETPNVRFFEHRNGRGTIHFGPEFSIFYPSPDSRMNGGGPALENIEDAKAVYRIIQTVRTTGH